MKLPLNKQRDLGIDTRPKHVFCVIPGCNNGLDGECLFEVMETPYPPIDCVKANNA